jgi:hypothetical protein
MTGGSVEVPCVECGSRDVDISRPEWVQRLREWLRFGGPWRPSRSTCRRCGGVSGVGASTMGREGAGHHRAGGPGPGPPARDLPVDGAELVQITDLEPYVQGTRRFDEGARARHSDPHG